MKIDILTLFPEMFTGVLNESIIKRAKEKELVDIKVHNIRDYSPYKNKQVDDYGYGGGAGMVLMCEPIFNAIESIKTNDSYIVMLTPSGETFNQRIAYDYSNLKHLILLCGHYEGFDERIKTIVDKTLSVGDYVLTGGEIPAMAVVDAVTRLIPGVINNESLANETFNDDLVDYPEKIEITSRTDEKLTTLELRVDPSDMGKVIGRQGKIAKSIRALMKAYATKQGLKINVDIMD